MAVQLHPEMFTLGAVNLNNDQSVNFYAQALARRQAQKQAKEDAFQEYIRGLNTKINTAGMRVAQETPVFNDKYKKWVEYGIKNKDKLMKRDLEAQAEFDFMYRDLQNVIQESKTEEEKKKPFVEMALDPTKRARMSSNVFTALDSHDSPLFVQDEKGEWIRNPKRKSIDYKDSVFDPQFDFSKAFDSWSKGMDKGKNIGDIISSDPKSGQVIRAYEESYSPEQLKQISLNAGRGVADNPEYKNYYQLRWENMSDAEHKKLDEAFQSVFGKEIKLPSGHVMKNSIDSPEEIAMAESILQAKSLTKKGEEAVLDRELANQRAINKIYINQSLGGGGSASPTIKGNEFDRIPIPKSMFPTTKPIVPIVQVPAGLVATLKAGGIDLTKATDIELNVKNGVIQSITPRDEKGNPMTSVDRKDMENAQLKYNSEPQKGPQMQFGGSSTGNKSATYKIKGKTYTEAELLKMGYTVDQIAPYKQ